MPQTINKRKENQIIGGIFSDCESAHQAVKAFQDANISGENIQIIVKRNDDEAEDSYTGMLEARGFSETQALYHNKVIREGKVLLFIYEVEDAGLVIDIFDKCGAEYNPNGSRNLRADVAGMTAGVVAGATVGGLVGAALAGPVGVAAGAAVGALAGGSSGMAVGKAVEHQK